MSFKKQLLLIMLSAVVGGVKAQVSVALQVPPTGVVQKNQLWNMVLVNGSSAECNVEVTLTLSSTTDNNPVLTATGRVVTLAKGAHQCKYSDFAPVNYRYLSAIFNADMRPEGFLPVGNYTACYTVSRWIGDLPEPLAEECVSLEVQPLMPPVLNLPADGSVVESRSPQFTWLPPAPLQLMGDLNYDVVIAKVTTGQNALTAVQQNIPVYNEAHRRNTFLNYPASASLLDTGITYAWCVIARNSDRFVAQSDVFTFTVSGKQAEVIVQEGASYIRLKRDAETALAISAGDVAIEYTHDATDKVVSYTIYPLDNSSRQLASGTLKVVQGQNFITLPSSVTRKLQEHTSYRLELTNTRNEKWGARFTYRTKK
ncbi:hypothetical protein FLA_3657 [Filimonas lacunae]|nr:hypothetical protein FLA_3657 [Filimonas lacunae]